MFNDEEQRAAKSNRSHLPDATKIELDYARRKTTTNPLLFSPDPKKKVVTQVDPTKQERRAVAVGDAMVAVEAGKQPRARARSS